MSNIIFISLILALGFSAIAFYMAFRKTKKAYLHTKQKLKIALSQKQVVGAIEKMDSDEEASLNEFLNDIYTYLNESVGNISRITLFTIDQKTEKAKLIGFVSDKEPIYKIGTELEIRNFKGYALLTKLENHIINDLKSESYKSETDVLQLKDGINSYMSLPIISDNILLGFINFSSSKINFFDLDNIQFINDLINPISSVLTLAQEHTVISRNLAKMDRKNKKTWQMSLAVHKQKEEVALKMKEITEEKQLLEAEKDKIKKRNQKLWETSVNIHKEKEKIEQIKRIIEEKHKNVTDSINYAKRIQTALLSKSKTYLEETVENFILFKPRDIVSGDFYWILPKIDNDGTIFLYICVADCTGHGVPGAFMSMLGINLLNEINGEIGILTPSEIVNTLRRKIIFELDQEKSFNRDGMDLGIVRINLSTKEALFTGANNPLYLICNNEIDTSGCKNPIVHEMSGGNLLEIKAHKEPVGYREHMSEFYDNSFHLNKGDHLYLLSDGMPDQFGGGISKKYTYKRLRDSIFDTHNLSKQEQCEKIIKTFLNWQGEEHQIDDICLIGIRI